MDMLDLKSRTWAEISLENIEHNYREIKRHTAGAKFLGVVKANAYGCGAVNVASLLERIGCDYLATATVSEALELRRAGITLPILVLGYTVKEDGAALIENGITQNISSLAMAKDMSGTAVKLGKALKAHLKLDSGMGRLGRSCGSRETCVQEALEILNLPGLDFEGVFTHFSVSESEEKYTREQFKKFTEIVSEIEEKSGHKFKIHHCANSGATLFYPEMHLDMVRPGIALYGYAPGDSLGGFNLRPALELKSRVYSLKTVACGESVSYGRRFKAGSDRLIAVMPMGYADGLHRVLSGKLEVIIRGKKAPQVGSICMDMCMVDVTDIPGVELMDEITVFGKDGTETASVEEAAKNAGTISYELLCAISERVPRIYK